MSQLPIFGRPGSTHAPSPSALKRTVAKHGAADTGAGSSASEEAKRVAVQDASLELVLGDFHADEATGGSPEVIPLDPGAFEQDFIASVPERAAGDLEHALQGRPGQGPATSSEVEDDEEEDVSLDAPLMPLAPWGAIDGNHWTVGSGGDALFGNRAMAQDLLERQLMGLQGGCGDVGIVILDVGLSSDYIRSIGKAKNFGGGFQRRMSNDQGSPHQVGLYFDPTARPCDGHGNMVARNVLALAPDAVLYDAPILPSRVTNVAGFASTAVPILRAIRHVIRNPGGDPRYPTHRSWIIVNAWSVASSFADRPGPLGYRFNRRHRLNMAIIRLARLDNVDVVFAAGNSGVFQPAAFSGVYDRGHGRSITGANGLDDVFTIGACRCDGLPIGASSQGPSDPALRRNGRGGDDPVNRKPDFVCPSWFCENSDATVANTGSSAACGLFAGALASIRQTYPDQSSDEIKTILGAGIEGARWSAQNGFPIAFAPSS